jgi:hypothetical protein
LPFAVVTGALVAARLLPLERVLPLPAEGCEVARRVAVFTAAVLA